MRFSTPCDLRCFPLKLAMVALAVAACAQAARSQAPPATVAPNAVAAVSSFVGRIDYTMHRADAPDAVITGSLSVGSTGWTLDERSGSGSLHASATQNWMRVGTQTLLVEDPFSIRSLANPWVLALGESAGQPVAHDRSGVSWTVGGRLRLYPDRSGTQIAGLVDLSGAGTTSFSFDDWHNAGGMWLPDTIVRLDDGLPDASFAADDYRVVWSARAAAAPVAAAPGQIALPDAASARTATTSSIAPRVWHSFRLLFALLAGGFALAAWLRRDVLTERVGRWVAADLRAWRSEGTSVFVSPEGVLSFEGRRYRVGARFFNRAALVQSSPLFLKVSAPGAGSPTVVARRFSLVPQRTMGKRTRGFTLIEALVAAALFAVVVVAAVMPTLIVLAHADRLAQIHETAVQVATNALVDEESALAYGFGIADNSATSVVDGLHLTVTVAPGTLPGMHQVTASVDDGSGVTLARVSTLVGPPVPAPEASPPPATNP